MSEPARPPISLTLADAQATEALGARAAALLGPGDVVCLIGPLGAGKTTFARGAIAALTGGAEEVPSPTYTLVQTYEASGFEVWHADLYRLESAEDARELGLEEAFDEAVVLVEWPERLNDRLPADRLEVRLAPLADGTRAAELIGRGRWRDRLIGF